MLSRGRRSMSRLATGCLFILGLAGCVRDVALQPDRSIFSLDNNYQRQAYDFPIQEAFDRTVHVFTQAGYRLDVVDRATGQISGRRGAAGRRNGPSDKDLKFYALVVPRMEGSELSIKIVQIVKAGGIPLVGASRSELIVNDRQLYAFLFQRIADVEPAAAPPPADPNGLP